MEPSVYILIHHEAASQAQPIPAASGGKIFISGTWAHVRSSSPPRTWVLTVWLPFGLPMEGAHVWDASTVALLVDQCYDWDGIKIGRNLCGLYACI